MGNPIYTHDRGEAALLASFDNRLKRLENGGLLQSAVAQFRAAASLTGAWPSSTAFTTTNPNSTVLLIWNITAFSVAGTVTLTATLKVDGNTVDSTSLFFNPTNTHLTFPLGVASVTGLATGSHTAAISLSGGSSDANDKGHILVVEFPA
jgi:hypothetical protein